MDGLCPLQQGIIAYAAKHEVEIREAAIEEMRLRLSSAPWEQLLAKFLKDCKEHGAIDPLTDWRTMFEEEADDGFWYTAADKYFLEQRE